MVRAATRAVEHAPDTQAATLHTRRSADPGQPARGGRRTPAPSAHPRAVAGPSMGTLASRVGHTPYPTSTARSRGTTTCAVSSTACSGPNRRSRADTGGASNYPPRSMSSRGLDYLALWLSGFGKIGAAVTRWADESFDRETTMLDEHLATLARIMAARGADARPATAGQMDYLLRRSAAIGLPLDIDGVISGGGDWTDTDIASLEDLADLSLTPGRRLHHRLRSRRRRRYSAAVIVLTIGRMAPMPIPEQMLPWQVIGDGSGEPLEWSERITLEEKTATARAMRFVTDKITNQFKHYTVEHDESPPTELQEQHAAAQKIKTHLEHDHSGGLSTRVKGWWRMAVVGANADEVRRKVSTLQEMYSPHIILEHEHGQYQLLREFIPGQRQANIAHARRMSVYDASAGMAAVGDRIGDRTGLIVGQTASIAPRPAVWNCFAGPENKDKSGLTPPIVAVPPGSGKTFLAGMTVYQAVRAGAYGVILDPSGPLARLATLPELAPFTRVYALTGRSRPGALNPYRVIADPDPDDPRILPPTHSHYALDPDPAAAAEDQYQADLRAAAAERMECAVSVLKMMLTDKDVEQRWTESVLHTAAHNVGGDAEHHLGQVLDQLAAMAENEQDTEVKTTARSIHQKLHMMSQLAEARVLFPQARHTRRLRRRHYLRRAPDHPDDARLAAPSRGSPILAVDTATTDGRAADAYGCVASQPAHLRQAATGPQNPVPRRKQVPRTNRRGGAHSESPDRT